jgi:hypothetical protein
MPHSLGTSGLTSGLTPCMQDDDDVVVIKFQDHKNMEYLGKLNNQKFLKGASDHVISYIICQVCIIIFLQITLDVDIPINLQTNQ